MQWMTYRRAGAIGSTRLLLTRGRRRVLQALLCEASGLDIWELSEKSRIGAGTLYPFLYHLTKAGWAASEERLGSNYYWSLTEQGRRYATGTLGLPD